MDRQPPLDLRQGSGDCTGPMDPDRRVRITCKYAVISVVPSLGFLILHFCDFCVSPLLLFGGSWRSLGPATASERRVTIHCKYAGIGALASCDFSTWLLFKFLKCPLLLLGGPGGTRGPPRMGKKCRLRSLDPALVRRTDRLHIYNGLWLPGPSHP